MTVKDFPIFGEYNVQQFLQICPEDIANWTMISNDKAKKKFAMIPAMGRKHVVILEKNILIFDNEPRLITKSVDYSYVFDGNNIYRYDVNFNRIQITPTGYTTTSGPIYFDYLVAPSYTLVIFTDGHGAWVHNESTNDTIKISDPSLIENPTAVKVFGNRVAMTGRNRAEFRLSKINLGPLVGANVDPAACFGGGTTIFAYETENIVNFAVLHNTFYIFMQSTTSVWSNIPSVFGATNGVIVQFPWKKNTTYNFDYGLSAPFALSAGFNRMVWLGKNQEGLNQIVVSEGSQPVPISTKAIDILLERDSIADELSPFLGKDVYGFLYQYQNTVFFRLSAGRFFDLDTLDVKNADNSIEYNFDTKQWKRCIESNGERCRIQQHVFFSDRHLVTVTGEKTVYEMSGQIYTNELRNTDQENEQASDAYIKYPFRYIRTTPIISEPDYSEFITDYVQIDFVWGDRTFVNANVPFENTEFIISEEGEYLLSEDGAYLITEGTNTPGLNETFYNKLFKPHIELFYSDDAGISFISADVREFSQLGVYKWRMRWYELGASRDRVYKLICVSPAPLVILGAIMETRRVSGGAN